MCAKVIFSCAALLLPLIAQGQIYKCMDEANHVTYQDRPCPVGQSAEPTYEAHARLSIMSSAAINDASELSAQELLEERKARALAAELGVVLTGSHISDAERLMGRPDSRRNYSIDGKACEHLTWRDQDGRISGSVRACNGAVIYFSNRIY